MRNDDRIGPQIETVGRRMIDAREQRTCGDVEATFIDPKRRETPIGIEGRDRLTRLASVRVGVHPLFDDALQGSGIENRRFRLDRLLAGVVVRHGNRFGPGWLYGSDVAGQARRRIKGTGWLSGVLARHGLAA